MPAKRSHEPPTDTGVAVPSAEPADGDSDAVKDPPETGDPETGDPETGDPEDAPPDYYIHVGPMDTGVDDTLIRLAERPRAGRAVLFICTYGGQARAAYRMIRGLRHAYGHVTVVVGGHCKSAGTLVVIGADEIVMTGGAELGPLDVQVLKENDLVERRSGLAPASAFQQLSFEALNAWRTAFFEMKYSARLTTALAADIAAKLAIGTLAPVYAQIDPLRVGEMAMANAVALRYAEALQQDEDGEDRSNVKPNTLTRLITGYPSHDYVIDRHETRSLFKRVRNPTPIERRMLASIGQFSTTPPAVAITHRLTPEEVQDAQQPPPDPPAGEAGDGSRQRSR